MDRTWLPNEADLNNHGQGQAKVRRDQGSAAPPAPLDDDIAHVPKTTDTEKLWNDHLESEQRNNSYHDRYSTSFMQLQTSGNM
jgi:hypothetical protein